MITTSLGNQLLVFEKTEAATRAEAVLAARWVDAVSQFG
jgi:hypothetical protein